MSYNFMLLKSGTKLVFWLDMGKFYKKNVTDMWRIMTNFAAYF